MKIHPLLCALLPLAACSSPVEAAIDDSALLGLGIRNSVQVDEHLVSAGQPTEEQFAELGATGFTHVIHLRPADEDGTGWEEARAEKLGLHFTRIPVAGAAGLTEENARALEAAIRDAGGAGVLVSCGSGNRVGGLLALRAHFCAGVAPPEALELGKRAGLTRAEPAVRAALGLGDE